MEPEDLPAAGAVSAGAFGVDISGAENRARWHGRVAHALGTDADGAFVAERDGQVVGVAEAIVRERLWLLSLLAVDPHGQSGGAGRALMARALDYGRPDLARLIVSSNDSRALRLYAGSGFRLRPTFQAEGVLDRRRIPADAARVREVGDPDFEALAENSRAVRGAPHTPELQFALGRGGRLLTHGERGFAVAMPGYGVWLLVAREPEAATRLLWRALEVGSGGESLRVRWISQDQPWAIEVVLAARLALGAYGALCVRGEMGPLAPYLPSAPFG